LQVSENSSPDENVKLLKTEMMRINKINTAQKIITGRVLITRSPSVHPGDIQTFTCVDKPELHHLENVVVFSSKGERPDANKMSCGDLDGDIYLIMWQKGLLDYIQPEDIHPPAPLQDDHSVVGSVEEYLESDDICDYMTYFFERNFLGLVANTWVKLAQQKGENGPMDSDCLSIAQCHQVMVDFGKHGKCITLKRFQSFRDMLRKLEVDQLNGRIPQTTKILDKIMQNVKIDVKLRQYMENDWQHSIKQNIKMSVEIIDISSDNVYTIPKFFAEPQNG
jgi:ASC-1-like (ASCH) protein